MKETEITVEVLDSFDVLQEKLKNKGFKLQRQSQMKDYYVSKYSIEELKKMDYSEIIANSFLVRKIGELQELLFKKKELDDNGNVIAEEKFDCGISNIEDAINVFKLSNLNVWMEVIQNMWIYEKEKTQFAVQVVDGLGTFIEYEEDAWMSHMTEKEKIEYMLEDLRSIGLNLGNDFNCKKVYMLFKKVV